MLNRLLSHLGWKKKFIVFSSFYMALIFIVGGFGAYTIYSQNDSLQTVVYGSQKRVDMAASARVSVIEMGRALANVIAASDRKEIRIQAVQAIRSLSLLDEKLQTLAETLTNNAQLDELSGLLKKIRPMQMELIKAAKKNDDIAALERATVIQAESDRIEQLSQEIVAQERHLLQELQQVTAEKGVNVIIIMGILIGIGFIIGVSISLIGGRLMTKPLEGIEQTMNAVANGDLSVKLDTKSKDEIGRTVSAISKTVNTLHGIISSIRSNASNMGQQSHSVNQSAEELQSLSTELHDSVIQIKSETDTVDSISENVKLQLAEASENARSTSETSKRTSEEITASVNEFKRFHQNMDKTAQVTRQLSESAKAITSITATIRDISEQTNLLALNAAIEAARAGEQGRGFAVVADEVRTLASRTEDATTEISGVIDTISGDINSTVHLLEESVSDANKNIEQLAQLVDETQLSSQQATHMQEAMNNVVVLIASQGEAVQQITHAVKSLSEVSSNSNAQTDNLHKLSAILNEAALDLNKSVDQFVL